MRDQASSGTNEVVTESTLWESVRWLSLALERNRTFGVPLTNQHEYCIIARSLPIGGNREQKECNMLIQIAGLVMIPPALVALQRKTPLVGNYLADSRLSLIKVCEQHIKSQMKKKSIDEAAATAAITNIRLLKKHNDAGWVSEMEYTALGQVLGLAAKSGSTEVLHLLNVEIGGMKSRAVEAYDAYAQQLKTYVEKGVAEIKKRFGT
jgi:YD repeat-containing protein